MAEQFDLIGALNELGDIPEPIYLVSDKALGAGFIPRHRARGVAALLREAGYTVSDSDCHAFANNLAKHMEPMDTQARFAVNYLIAKGAGWYKITDEAEEAYGND